MHHGWALLATALVLAGPVQAQRVARPSAAALEAARRFLCPNGGVPQRVAAGRRGGRCTPAPGGGGIGGGGADAVPGWDIGLPAANQRQAPCPPGTVPAASAQAAAIRCVPG